MHKTTSGLRIRIPDLPKSRYIENAVFFNVQVCTAKKIITGNDELQEGFRETEDLKNTKLVAD